MFEINTLLLIGGLMFFSGIFAKFVADKVGFPLLLLFLVVGMLAGEDGILGIHFDNFELAFLFSNLALAIILLDGGLRTQLESFRTALGPAGVLATAGVVLTAGIVGTLATVLLGVPWQMGLLLGAIIGSTDAAAVFNMLRQSGIQLNERVKSTLEIESGANDPMAIFLVIFLIELVTLDRDSNTVLQAGIMLLQQFGFGAVAGLAGGWVLARLINNMRLAEGLYGLLVTSGGIMIFAIVNKIGGSGFLAIYLTGILVGNYGTRESEQVKQAMDALAWLAQAGLFLLLGLLVTPSRVVDIAPVALAIAAFLILVARPAAVFACLLPFRFPLRELVYISWVGLRGAVPIVLAIFPLMSGVPGARLFFDITFAVVLASLIVQGSSLAAAARWLKVIIPYRATPVDSRELWIGREQRMELLAFAVEENSRAEGGQPASLARLKIPGVEFAQLVRNGQRLAEDQPLYFQEGDVVWLFANPGSTDDIAQYFSHREESGALATSTFFGEFVINGDSPASNLANLYGLELSERQQAGTVADLMIEQKGRRLVVGDRVRLSNIHLTVRRMAGGQIDQVGLKI